MSPRLKERLPLFELSLVLVAAIIGWAEVRLSHLKSQADRDRENFGNNFTLWKQAGENWRQEAQRFQQQNQQLQQVFVEFRSEFTNELKPLQETKKHDELTLPENRRLQEEYSTLAEVIQTNITEMQAALTRKNLGKDPVELARFQRRSEELKGWISKQKERAQLERFEARSEELKERIDKERSAPTEGLVPIPKDLGALLNEMNSSYSNYVKETEELIINDIKKNYYGPEFDKRLENAGAEAGQLLRLAAQAHTGASGIKTFLDWQWQSEGHQRAERLQPVIQSFLKAQARLETNNLLRPQNETTSAGLAASENTSPSPGSWAALYPLLLAQIGLGIFLMVAIYRRLVVDRLRVRLSESTAENKLAHFEKLAVWQAHEIKQPLTAITAWLWTLQQTLPDGTPEHRIAAAIRKETDRLDQFVKDFLKLARPLDPKLVPLKAEPVLQEIQLLFQPRLEQQSIKLNLESTVDVRFRADPQQLKQVLINLVQNAAESIERDGSITLRARQDRVPLKGRTSEVVIIEVEDNGPGIPPEVQERLFEPFFSTKKEGTGLGLPIAVRIIDKHGGALEFKSFPGKGTTFGVVLPVYRDGG